MKQCNNNSSLCIMSDKICDLEYNTSIVLDCFGNKPSSSSCVSSYEDINIDGINYLDSLHNKLKKENPNKKPNFYWMEEQEEFLDFKRKFFLWFQDFAEPHIINTNKSEKPNNRNLLLIVSANKFGKYDFDTLNKNIKFIFLCYFNDKIKMDFEFFKEDIHFKFYW